MILHSVEEDLHDWDEEAEEEPDVDVLKTRRPGEIVGETGQHGGHHEHGLPWEQLSVQRSV